MKQEPLLCCQVFCHNLFFRFINVLFISFYWPKACFFLLLLFQLQSFCNLQGEEYKLFWPDQQEFVRMAAKFGATIVPFGTVGEDDVAEVRPFFATYFIYFVMDPYSVDPFLFFCCVISTIFVYLKANLGKIEEKKPPIFSR